MEQAENLSRVNNSLYNRMETTAARLVIWNYIEM
jgi:hypothetical protein